MLLATMLAAVRFVWMVVLLLVAAAVVAVVAVPVVEDRLLDRPIIIAFFNLR